MPGSEEEEEEEEEKEEENVVRWPDEGAELGEYDGIGEQPIKCKALAAAEAEEDEKLSRVGALLEQCSGAESVHWPGVIHPAPGAGHEIGGQARGHTSDTIAASPHQVSMVTHEVSMDANLGLTCELNAPLGSALYPIAMTQPITGAAEMRVRLGTRWSALGQSEVFCIAAEQLHSIQGGVQRCSGGSAWGYAARCCMHYLC